MKIINSSGKKKTATARATLKEGKGIVRINKVPLDIYEPKLARLKIQEPVQICGDLIKAMNIDVVVSGGGIMGQTDAVRTAIAKGIVEWTGDTALKEAFSEYDRNLLVSDHRQKEKKKFGGLGARSKYQKSYRCNCLIPVRCFSCGKVVSHVWEEYRERIKTEPPGKVLDDLGIDKYCCRRMLLSHVEIVETLRRYQ
jgi:small subunit ribosomal protein S9